MRTTLIAALLCAISLLLSCAHAQQSEAHRQVLAQLRAGAEGGNAEFQLQLGLALAWGKHGLARNLAEAV